MNDSMRAANSGSTSLRSPEPVPVSALPGNDPGRKCECSNEGSLNPAYADWYDAELELPYVNHAPGECQCTNELAQYRIGGGETRWLCSCCHMLGDERLATPTETPNGN